MTSTRRKAPQKHFIIDALGPFFTAVPPRDEYNWSKVPFSELEHDDGLTESTIETVCTAFESYADTVARIGYSAVSIDDLAHMVIHPFYPGPLQQKLRTYQSLYTRLYAIASRHGLRVFVNTDIMFFNEAVRTHTRGSTARSLRLLVRTIRLHQRAFPHTAGIIVRLGESDGIDVDGDFHSELMVRTVRQCRRLIRALLPTFERHGTTLIVRSWTLGAFEIGDLMWNVRTFHRVFDGIYSDNLIVAHKFGETDFFRYLNLNPLFFESAPAKIVELQARREYEGFGEFPSFVGFDYERYARYLSDCENLRGISVWCQTGGWSHFDRLTYLRNSSLWVELNTGVALRIFRNGESAEQAVEAFLAERLPGADPDQFIQLLRYADQVIKELWYIPEFSRQRQYFRRTRVPPLLWNYWDHVIINHTLRKIIRRFVHERNEAIHDGYRMLQKVRRMQQLAEGLGLDGGDLEHQYAVCKVIAMGREYYLGDWDPKLARSITEEIQRYRQRYPHGFHIICDFSPVQLKKWMVKTIFRLSVRHTPNYRWIDRIFFLRFAALVYPIVNWWQKRRLPSFARSQAMGIQTLFK